MFHQKILTIIFIVAGLSSLHAEDLIEYHVSFPNIEHHEAEISVSVTGIEPGRALRLRMSQSSPGYYAAFEFSKNVYNVKAETYSGEPVEIYRSDTHQWTVPYAGESVTVRYTLFADYMDGTYSSVGTDHIYLNIPSAFLWVENRQESPIAVSLDLPEESWTIKTQLPVSEGENRYSAPDLDYFIDSPIVAGRFEQRLWQIEKDGRSQDIELAFLHYGQPDEILIAEELISVLMEEEKAVFGDYPDFDYGKYTFIATYIPSALFDGMEHRNSTVATSNEGFADDLFYNLWVLAHEFFHVWNCERLAPEALEPFDLTKPNMTAELWFVEGVTSYYTDLLLVRSGIYGFGKLVERIESRINYIYNEPGPQIHSLAEASRLGTIFHGGVFEDRTNKSNIFVSFYWHGFLVSMALDLEIRGRYPGLSMDDYMRALWEGYLLDGAAYTNEDLEMVLAELTGDGDFAEDFFRRYIYGNELPDLGTLLAKAGIILSQPQKTESYIGPLDIIQDDMILLSGTIIGTPLYQAGLDRGDRILSLEDVTVKDKEDLERFLSKKNPGDIIRIEFLRPNGQEVSKELIVQGNPVYGITLIEDSESEISENITEFRNDWISPRSMARVRKTVRRPADSRVLYPVNYENCPLTGEDLDLIWIGE